MKSLDGALYVDASFNGHNIKVAGDDVYATYAYRKDDGGIGFSGPGLWKDVIPHEKQTEEQKAIVAGLEDEWGNQKSDPIEDIKAAQAKIREI